ncbi:MAG: hypothetical protein V3T88_05545 [Nitrosomonadaceae bacterium]
MGKRLTVKYTGETEYNHVKLIAAGTEFKAVLAKDYGEGRLGILIRGSSLRTAAGDKTLFPSKQYLFVTGRKNSEMVVVQASPTIEDLAS